MPLFSKKKDSPHSEQRVLIADDEGEIRSLLKQHLLRLIPDIHVSEAANGVDALSQLNNYKHDLLITDLKMPFMDGASLIENLVNIEDDKRPEDILVISGCLGDENIKPHVCNLKYMAKPFNPDILGKYISDYLPKDNYKILIVENEVIIRMLIKESIEKMFSEIKIVEATNGLEALDHLKNNSFPLLITDLKMPNMDGDTLIKHINDLPRNKRPANILVLSGFLDPKETRPKNFNIVYMAKPFDKISLNQYLKKVLKVDGDNT